MNLKKTLSIVLSGLIAVSMLSACDKKESDSTDNGKVREMTSNELVHDMGLGWNLGNTLDVCNADRSGNGSVDEHADEVDETLWGNPKATKELFEALKDDGVKSVRIPVTWRDHLGEAPEYKINDEWMDRVQEVVDYARECGMYVIINLHHDGGDDVDFGAWIKKADKDYDGVIEKYKALWAQIAERFKDYSDYLVFESMNEVGYDNIPQEDGIALVNKINQEFVNLIRTTGGNNDKRHLLIAGYWTDITRSCQGIVMPKDSADRCILSVHYYTPWQFCINGDPATWGSEGEINELNRLFDMLKTNFTDNGVPVILGEYGVNSAAEDESRIYWCESVVKKCTELGIATFFWDNGEEVDRNTYKWRTDGLLDALKRASSGDDYTVEPPKAKEPSDSITDETKIIELHDFTGRQIDEVLEKYEGFLNIKVIEEENKEAKSGEILKQDQIEGKFITRGETLNLTVAK